MNRKLSPHSTLVILTGLNLFDYMDRYVLNAVRTPMAADFGLGYGDSGRLFTAFMVGYFVTSPFFGFLGDRLSRKVLIALGIFVWSLGTVLTGLAQSFAMLLCFRALVGVGEASYATLSPGLISDTWGREKRNNALTLFYAAIPVGSAVGYMLGGEIAGHWGWRYAFYWAGAPGLLLALILLPFQEPRRGEVDSPVAGKPEKATLGDAARLFMNRDYMLVVWGYVAYTFALGAFAFWGPRSSRRFTVFALTGQTTFSGRSSSWQVLRAACSEAFSQPGGRSARRRDTPFCWPPRCSSPSLSLFTRSSRRAQPFPWHSSECPSSLSSSLRGPSTP